MTDRDSEIERICQAALDCPTGARAELLANECRGDADLRREVEALLAFETAADRFLEPQSLPVPSQLGPYEIQSVLGIGGMGEVYRARDTVLGRDVALKVIPRLLAADPERVSRLQREARTLAALNHPNIAHIYGIEQGALVMELVHGSTLTGPLPVSTALDYASQIAAALEAAHEKGVVHRDLKPTNVMTTPDRIVKVLDFGIASIDEAPSRDASLVQEELTTPARVTMGGAIMGTAAYMSPEQASGTVVDKRTDIWSFGVVLWELLTGRPLFEGDTSAETLSNVTSAPIALGQLPRETPPAVRELLARCLDRDPKTRLRDIGEARLLIQRCLTTTPPPPSRFSRAQLARAATWVSAGLAVVFGLLFVMERRARRPDPPFPLTFRIPTPPQTTVVSGPALSPNGRHVAFTARDADGRVRIWVHALDSATAQVLAGTENAFSPLFWSPDSRFVGFATPTTLSKVPVTGGPPAVLCERCGPASIGSRVFRGGAWSSDGVIVYAISSNGLWRLPDTGGAPTRVTPAGDYGYPAFLGSSERLLYTWFGRDPEPGVYVTDLARPDQRPSKRLVDGAFVLGGYVASDRTPPGYLLALREGVLTARPFDLPTATVTGEAIVLAQDVPTVDPPAAFSASSTGAIAFTTSTAADRSRLVWVDRQGMESGQVGATSYGSNISISPNGRYIAFDSIESDRRTRRIWSADPIRGVVSVLNAPPGAWMPATSSSGDIAFIAAPELYLTSPSAIGDPETLYHAASAMLPNGWSPDGRFLIFNQLHPTRRADLYVLSLEQRSPIPLVVTDADEWPAAFSPDGRWIAYSSDETGTREVYVRDFVPTRVPAVGSVKIRVSPDGGDKPRWRRDGTELYYVAPDGRLMAARVNGTPNLSVGNPATLFNVRLSTATFPYDVASDGRFLMNTLDPPSADPSTGMTVVLNWMALGASAALPSSR